MKNTGNKKHRKKWTAQNQKQVEDQHFQKVTAHPNLTQDQKQVEEQPKNDVAAFFQMMSDYKKMVLNDGNSTELLKEITQQDLKQIIQSCKINSRTLQALQPNADWKENLALINQIDQSIDQAQGFIYLCTWYIEHSQKNQRLFELAIGDTTFLESRENLTSIKNALTRTIKTLTGAKQNLETHLPTLGSYLTQPLKNQDEELPLPDKYIEIFLDVDPNNNEILGEKSGGHSHMILYDHTDKTDPKQIYIDLRTDGDYLNDTHIFKEKFLFKASQLLKIPKLNDRKGILAPTLTPDSLLDLNEKLARNKKAGKTVSIIIDCDKNKEFDFDKIWSEAEGILNQYQTTADPSDSNKQIYPYNVYTNNCAHIVFNLLKAAGILEIAKKDNIPIPIIITPYSLKRLVQAVNFQLNDAAALENSEFQTTYRKQLRTIVSSILSDFNLKSLSFENDNYYELGNVEINLPLLDNINIEKYNLDGKEEHKQDESQFINFIKTILYGIDKKLNDCPDSEINDYKDYLNNFILKIAYKLSEIKEANTSTKLKGLETILNSYAIALQTLKPMSVQKILDTGLEGKLYTDFSSIIGGKTLMPLIINKNNKLNLTQEQQENLTDVNLLFIANGHNLTDTLDPLQSVNKERIEVLTNDSYSESSQKQLNSPKELKSAINNALQENAVLNENNEILKICFRAINTDESSLQNKNPKRIVIEKKINTKNALLQLLDKQQEAITPHDLGLISDNERNPGKIYLSDTDTGLSYEVKDQQGEIKRREILWNQLPQNFPRKAADIVKSKDAFLPTLLMHTSKAGFTSSTMLLYPKVIKTMRQHLGQIHQSFYFDSERFYNNQNSLLCQLDRIYSPEHTHSRKNIDAQQANYTSLGDFIEKSKIQIGYHTIADFSKLEASYDLIKEQTTIEKSFSLYLPWNWKELDQRRELEVRNTITKTLKKTNILPYEKFNIIMEAVNKNCPTSLLDFNNRRKNILTLAGQAGLYCILEAFSKGQIDEVESITLLEKLSEKCEEHKKPEDDRLIFNFGKKFVEKYNMSIDENNKKNIASSSYENAIKLMNEEPAANQDQDQDLFDSNLIPNTQPRSINSRNKNRMTREEVDDINKKNENNHKEIDEINNINKRIGGKNSTVPELIGSPINNNRDTLDEDEIDQTNKLKSGNAGKSEIEYNEKEDSADEIIEAEQMLFDIDLEPEGGNNVLTIKK